MRRLKVWKIFLNKIEAMKPYGIQQLGIYYRDKRGVEIPAPDKKEREELAEVDESDIFDEAIVIERNEPEPSQAHAIQKRWSSFISSQIWNGPSCLFAVIVSVSTHHGQPPR